MHTPIVDRIVEQVETLTESKQVKVLEFVEKLRIPIPRGVAGKELLRFAGAISDDDVALMEKAIEEDCERVDLNEW
ncbi:MAG: hypothetical protein HY327_13610 [Chloroflexi bacterium]|nr:hypothetical protein [Chloroflexota bacterium]